jgi:hypothetical protein
MDRPPDLAVTRSQLGQHGLAIAVGDDGDQKRRLDGSDRLHRRDPKLHLRCEPKEVSEPGDNSRASVAADGLRGSAPFSSPSTIQSKATANRRQSPLDPAALGD